MNSMSEDQFWAEYEAARRATSMGGQLCKLVGSFLPIVLVIVGAGAASAGGEVTLVIWSVAFCFALMGAPIAALGTIANETKRQRCLMELDIKYR